MRLTLIIIFLFITTSEGRLFFVAPLGRDVDSGTVTSPLKTINKGVSLLLPGDTLFVRGGIYKEYVRITQSGDSINPIFISAYPGEKPVLDGSDKKASFVSPWPSLVWIRAAYVKISGLELKNSGGFGLNVSVGHHITVENVYVHNCYHVGVVFYRALYCSAVNCIVHDVYNYDSTGTGDGGDADCMSATSLNPPYDTVVSGYHTYRNNLLYNCSDDGFDVWTSKYNVFENNVVHHTGYSNSSNGGSKSIGEPAGNGNGFKLSSKPGHGGRNILRNNVSYANRVSGFDDNDEGNNTYYNNTAYNNPTGFRHIKDYSVLKNNLVFKSITDFQGIQSSVNHSYNSWNLGIVDPDFISTDEASPFFLRLLSRSAAIDAGVNIGMPYSGKAPDLGAYESNTSSSVMNAPHRQHGYFKVSPSVGMAFLFEMEGTGGEIDMFNSVGRRVWKVDINSKGKPKAVLWKPNALASGVYIAACKGPDGVRLQKFIVTH